MAAAVLLLPVGAAAAQSGPVSYDAGKTPAQLFASDCAVCHKSPTGLSKGGGIFGLQSFLREHYTTSRESAAALASYLQSMDAAAAGQGGKPSAKRGAKPEGRRAKPVAAKPGDAKPESRPGETKSGESKPAAKPDTAAVKPEPAPAEKPAEPKPAAADKPAAPADAKPAEAPKSE